MAVDIVRPVDASSNYYYQTPSRTNAIRTADPRNAFALLPFTGANPLQVFSRTASRPDALDNASLFAVAPEVEEFIDQIPGGSGITGEGPVIGGVGFLLTEEQQTRIALILENYREEAINEETYQRILADLQAQGLAPEQLALQNEINFFDPTASLLEGFSGQDTTSDLFNNAVFNTTTQAQVDLYTQQIVSMWLGISIVPSGGVVNMVA